MLSWEGQLACPVSGMGLGPVVTQPGARDFLSLTLGKATAAQIRQLRSESHQEVVQIWAAQSLEMNYQVKEINSSFTVLGSIGLPVPKTVKEELISEIW